MKNKILSNLINNVFALFIASLVWVGVSSTIQRFECPQMTETELFLHIPRSFMCDWRHCNMVK
jgi:hypothetical protein